MSDASHLAKNFNEHFFDIPGTIEKRIPPPKTNFNGYLENPSAGSFLINLISTDEVESLIKKQKNHKSSGLYSNSNI